MKSAYRTALVIILAVIISLTGCAKKITVTNDTELAQSVYGTWTFKASSQVEFWSEPNTENETYLGKASILNTNSISFSENQSFTMQTTSSVESLDLRDDSLMSKEEITQQVEKTMSISGQFSIDKNYLELNSENVLVNNIPYTAEEYSQIDSTFGATRQIQKWSLSNNSLTLSDLKGSSIVTFTKQ